jgi:hypothetical protein
MTKKSPDISHEQNDESLDDYLYIAGIYGIRSFDYKKPANPLYLDHMDARHDIEEKNYTAAAEKLKAILEKNANNAVLEYYVLCDIEECFKNTGDFKSAYEYSNRKISILEKILK